MRIRVAAAFLLAMAVTIAAMAAAEAQPRPPAAQLQPATPLRGPLGDLAARLDDDALAVRHVELRRTLRPLGADALRGRTVIVGERETEDLQAVATRVFAENAGFEREAQNSGAALQRRPDITLQALELPDSVMLMRATRVVVRDPSALARSSAAFRTFLGERGSLPVQRDALSAESRAGLDRFMANEVAALPADDPIAIAARQGPDAVLRAIAEGRGEFEMIDTIVLPTRPLPVIDGRVQHLQLRDGLMLHGQFVGSNSPLLRALAAGIGRRAQPPAAPRDLREQATIDADGRHRFSQGFLAGFTRGLAWEWEKRWRYTSGFFRISLGASFGFGVRIPIELSGQLEPAHIRRRDSRDRDDVVRLSATARTFDANASFYRRAGLDDDLVLRGHEFVLEARFYYGLKFRALWHDWVHIRRREIGFDFSDDFTPPLSGAERNAVRIEIPASVTNTALDLGVLRGEAQAGISLQGRGRVAFDYEALWGDQVRRRQRLEFYRPEAQTIAETLPALPAGRVGDRARQRFGFRFADPEYRVNLSLVPQLRVSVRVGVDGFSRRFSTGWISLNQFRVDLGTVSFERHAGTDGDYRFAGGVKEFEHIDAAPGGDTSTGPAEARGGATPVGNVVALRSAQNGRYVRGGMGRGAELAAVSQRVGAWETFDVVDLGQGRIALRVRANQRFVRAGVGDDSLLAATSARIGQWETFRLERTPDGRYALRSVVHNRLVRAGFGEETRLAAVSGRIEAWETFELVAAR